MFYIKELNDRFNDINGGYSTRPFKMLNVNFDLVNPYLPFGFDVLIPAVEKSILALNNLGVDEVIVPNMTLHLTLDKIDFEDEVKQKIRHPFKLMVQKLKKIDVKEITLIGTRYTMESEMFHNYFTDENIKVNAPSIKHIKAIDELRLKVYNFGYESKFKNELCNILSKYQNPVLACTELSMINSGCLDLVEVQLDCV